MIKYFKKLMSGVFCNKKKWLSKAFYQSSTYTQTYVNKFFLQHFPDNHPSGALVRYKDLLTIIDSLRKETSEIDMRLRQHLIVKEVVNHPEISTLNLTLRSLRALKRHNIKTVDQLRGLSDEYLLAVKGIGVVSLRNIRKALDYL